MSSYDLSTPECYKPDLVIMAVADLDFAMFDGYNVAFDAHGTLYEWAWGRMPEETANHINCFLDEGVIRSTAIASNLLHPLVAHSLGMIGPLIRAAELINASAFPLYGEEQKPNPAGLVRMATELEWDPARSVYFDDQLMGIRAAKDAGFDKAVLVNSPIGWEPPWIQRKRRGPEAKIRKELNLPQVGEQLSAGI